MNHQTNNCQLPAPCIIESGILVNKEDKIYLVKITGTNKNSFN